MGLSWWTRSGVGLRPRPRPVPELRGDSTTRNRSTRSTFVLKPLVVLLVVIVGFLSSGIGPIRLTAAKSGVTHSLGHSATSAVPTADAHQARNGFPTSTSTIPSSAAPPTTTTSASPHSTGTTQGSGSSSPVAVQYVTPPVPDQNANNQLIQSSGTNLYLNGSVYRFVGVDAYEIATQWGSDYGCGGEMSNVQLNQLFASLPPNSLVRFWAFQGTMAINPSTDQLNWGPIDRVFAAAAAYHQRLIPVLTDQGGTCDGDHWQDPSWYEGGFKSDFANSTTSNGGGSTPLSYWTYMQDIVNRYKNSPALGMWEPISEAEASDCLPGCGGHPICSNETVAAQALRFFFDSVGTEIHTLDPNHLVESGLLGGGQCGIVNGDYQYVSASPGIDVLSYHDYYETSPPGSPNWTSIDTRIVQAMALNKPIIAGEVGIQAGAGPGCMSLGARNADLSAKGQALAQAGGSGSLVWDWTPDVASVCSYDVGPNDPAMQAGGAVG
jgi:mannan endo-1,4-beta-mannosidase